MESSTNEIRKESVILAPRSRVWRAIADSTEFGAWFGVKFEGPFVPGQAAIGAIEYQGRTMPFEFVVDRIEPEHTFSYRWHPFGIDPNYDYSSEPMTLVTFTLADDPAGTKLTIVESGFDDVPLVRRAEAFRMNSGGWEAQTANITKYVEAAV